MAIRWESKRPNEVRDHVIDWSTFLGTGEPGADTIATSTVTVDGLTLDSDTNDDDSVTVVISGGAEGTTGKLTNTITTAAGREETEVFTVQVTAFPEPVSLAEAKRELRIVADDTDDALICSYIRSARHFVESESGFVLVRRSFVETFDYWTDYLQIHRRPNVVVDSIEYRDVDGATQSYVGFLTTTGRVPLRIYPIPGQSFPTLGTPGLVTVTYTAGFAEGETGEAVELGRLAILSLVAHWYANREAVSDRPANEVPLTAQALIDCFRAMVA